ncbi:hypothetical protein PMI03_02617 [Rhizobium sp. AP16]|nr:hypothetical protein PMI03_02617 [Rhizobium sp. AP16]
MRVAFVVIAVIAVLLSGCNDEPKHYLVLCDAQDANGWSLVNTEKSNGYIMACTYQSQDKLQSYTRRCDDSGCNIQ